jgi:hypothetical protein
MKAGSRILIKDFHLDKDLRMHLVRVPSVSRWPDDRQKPTALNHRGDGG